MRVSTLLTTLVSLTLPATAALADTRYGCMADNASVKLGVHVEFSRELGGKLSHLTGKLALSGPDVPAALNELQIKGDMVSQAWAGNGKLLMRFYDAHVVGAPLYISLAAVSKGEDHTRMHGTYTLDQAQGKGPGFHQEGTLFCQIDEIKPTASAF